MEQNNLTYEDKLEALREIFNDNPSGTATELIALVFDPNIQLRYENECRQEGIDRSIKFMRQWRKRLRMKPTKAKLKTVLIHNFVSGSALLLEYKYMLILLGLTIVTVIRTL